MEEIYLHKLSLRDIKPTAMRLLILRTMMEMKRAVSVTDLEDKLDTVDKSTIFRTLTLFLSHHLIHGVDDGSGSLKYAVCEDCCMCTVEDQHSISIVSSATKRTAFEVCMLRRSTFRKGLCRPV